MSSGPVRTRTFVMLLAAWTALSVAPVIGLGTPAAGAFAVLAAGLVAVARLRFSLPASIGVAAVCWLLFALVLAVGSVPPWALGADETARLGQSLLSPRTLGADLVELVSLLGMVAVAELASAGLEWDAVLRTTVGEREAASEPPPALPSWTGPDPWEAVADDAADDTTDEETDHGRDHGAEAEDAEAAPPAPPATAGGKA
jgi:hypothetical protein